MDSENDSSDAPKTAGSPVLGSSTFKRKFLKSKCCRKKLKLSDKFGDEILLPDRSSEVAKSSNSTLHSNSGIDKSVDNPTELKENELVIEKCLSNPNVPSKNELLKVAGFQTASGKPLFSNEESSNFANKLMGEFLNPLVVPLTEKKYSFLSKSSVKTNLRSVSAKCEKVSNFLGFEEKEYRYSLKVVETINYIFCTISLTTSAWQNFTNPSENDVLQIYVNDLCSGNNQDTHAQPKRIDPNEHIQAKIYAQPKKIIQEIKTQTQFMTGSGKKIKINSSSVSRLQSIFQGFPDIQNLEDRVPQSNTPRTRSDSLEISDKQNREMVKDVEIDVPRFATASGKKIEISSNRLSKVHSIFKDIAGFPSNLPLDSKSSGISNTGRNETSTHREENHNSNYSHSSSKSDRITVNSTTPHSKFNDFKNSCFKTIDQKERETNNLVINSTLTTKKSSEIITPILPRASGNTIELPPSNISRIDEFFEDIPGFIEMKRKSFKNCTEDFASPFSPALGKSMKLPTSNLTDIQNLSHIKTNRIGTEVISSLFSTASGKSIKIPSSSLTGVDNIFRDIPNFNDMKINSEGVSPSGLSKVLNDAPDLHRTELNNAVETNNTPLKKSLGDTFEEIIEQENNTNIDANKDNINYITPQRTLTKKRKLGSSLSKSGKIPVVALNKAKSLFGDMNFDDIKLPSHLKCGSPYLTEVSYTPKRQNQISTPQFFSTPLRTKNESFLNDVPQLTNQRFLIQKPKSGNLKDMEEELSRQRGILEKKLEIVVKKQEAIKMQMSGESSKKRFQLELQVKKNKMNLKDVKNFEVQSDCVVPTNSIISQVNPQNAVLIHFNNNWYEVPTVTTEDGCTLVPNPQGLIGISEIDPAFSSMPGIDKKLIPEGWIKNHYRWIVWKLASYERFFPATLGGCFSIDNVIKQLKHRYIKELYNVERPALRKIYERDDIAQKKMILCISNIIKNGDNTELELTDGWYSIRTLVDDPLCHQINNRKIKIGSKLIISGAELLNCDGCHPLELEQAQKVRLKINYNSTRRAAWFSKLGYQKDPSPLFIKLSSAIWNGGNIGRISFYIMRIYPVIYRERTESSVFWRNHNAEYKEIQEYENDCLKKYEEDRNVNIVKRNVCALLQMTVIDVFDNIPKPFKCTIWESSDTHQEQLKENQVVTCYNLTLRCNGELSCSKKTYFQISKQDTLKYEKYKRKCVELDSYRIMLDNTVFGEFDTIGFIVKMHIQPNSQCFWLTDLKNNFLLVKINEGPNQCLLLNKVEEEYLVAVCNLTLNSSRGAFSIATAGLHTIITQNPQYDFLRKSMEELENINRDEIQSTLRESRKTIDNFENVNKPDTNSSVSEGNSLNFSRVTSTDAVMSMINIDEIVSKHTM